MPRTAAQRKPIVAFDDPIMLDPKHYAVEYENDSVRILRCMFGPNEKSVMHDHPDSVAVCLTDQHVKFTFQDGETKDVTLKAGETKYINAGRHLPENLTDKPFELVLIELKG